MGTPPGGRGKPRTGAAGGTGSPAKGNERRGPRDSRCPRTGLCGRAAVLGTLLAAAAGKPAAARTALSRRVPARHPGRPRRSAEHRAVPAPRGQDPVLPGGGLEEEGEEALSVPAGVPPLAPHTQHVSPGASSLFPSDAGVQSCAGRAAPARAPSLPPRPRTSRPPQSPRTPLRSGQRGNLLPRFPPRLLTICLNLLLLLF